MYPQTWYPQLDFPGSNFSVEDWGLEWVSLHANGIESFTSILNGMTDMDNNVLQLRMQRESLSYLRSLVSADLVWSHFVLAWNIR